MVIKDGRFGPYVTDGETNASLRKGDSVEELTDERAVELLAERRDRDLNNPKVKAKRATAKKPAAKKPAAKKAPTKATAAKAADGATTTVAKKPGQEGPARSRRPRRPPAKKATASADTAPA